MDYSKILSISGKSGLFKLVATTKTGGIVESLLDGKRIPTFAADRISSVEDISIFTTGENVALKEVFKTIFEKENGGKILDSKSPESEIKAYITSIIPDWDVDRVYVSDIRKIISWYNLLNDKGLLDFTEDVAEEASTEEGQDKAKSIKEKPSTKAPKVASNASQSVQKSAAPTKAKSKQTVMKKTTTQSKAK